MHFVLAFNLFYLYQFGGRIVLSGFVGWILLSEQLNSAAKISAVYLIRFS